jgi:ankyrin repeat protein
LLANLNTFKRNIQKTSLERNSQKAHFENRTENEMQSGILKYVLLESIKLIFWAICHFIVYLLQFLLYMFGCANLHICVANQKIWRFWFSHYIFGESLEANNSDGLVPLQVAIKNLSKFAKDTKFARYLLYLGAANYAKTEEEKDQVLKILDLVRQSQNSTWFQFISCTNDLPVQSLTDIFIHAIQKLCKQKSHKNEFQNLLQTEINTIQISKLIHYLLKRGCNFGSVNEEGENAFHLIAHLNSFKDLEKLVEPHSLAEAINQPNLQLQTPLHLAVQNENSDYVRFLIDKGADLNSQDMDLRTPLHYAVSREKDECLNFLLKSKKAFVDAQDCEMKSPLHIASKDEKNKVVLKLINHGANVNLFDSKLKSPLDYSCRIKLGMKQIKKSTSEKSRPTFIENPESYRKEESRKKGINLYFNLFFIL